MNELLNDVLATIPNAGDKVDYEALQSQIEPVQHRRLYDALRLGKQNGVLRKYVGQAEDGSMKVFIERLA